MLWGHKGGGSLEAAAMYSPEEVLLHVAKHVCQLVSYRTSAEEKGCTNAAPRWRVKGGTTAGAGRLQLVTRRDGARATDREVGPAGLPAAHCSQHNLLGLGGIPASCTVRREGYRRTPKGLQSGPGPGLACVAESCLTVLTINCMSFPVAIQVQKLQPCVTSPTIAPVCRERVLDCIFYSFEHKVEARYCLAVKDPVREQCQEFRLHQPV